MNLSSCTRETFDDSGTRHNDMYSTIKTWLEDLVCEVDDAVSSDQFREWLDVQSEFHSKCGKNCESNGPIPGF